MNRPSLTPEFVCGGLRPLDHALVPLRHLLYLVQVGAWPPSTSRRPAGAIISALYQAVQDFARTRPIGDDITAILIKGGAT
jgi:hypothetical protein